MTDRLVQLAKQLQTELTELRGPTEKSVAAVLEDHLQDLRAFIAEQNSYKPEVLDTDAKHFCKALDKVEADEAGELRLATGIVLEPDVTDAQKDTYTAEEIRKTAHLYMIDYQNVGLQHKAIINSEVSVVESYIAPDNPDGGIKVGDHFVKSGTWIMTVKVFDDELWSALKRGDLTGFSIGGFARRIPIAEDGD